MVSSETLIPNLCKMSGLEKKLRTIAADDF